MQPTFFIPHGGGPCFFMDWIPPDTWNHMRVFLSGLIANLDEKPREILLITAHWETPDITLSTNLAPNLLFDYYNFPPHTYELTWPAPGAPKLAERAAELLIKSGIETKFDQTRGFDHGVFVPMKLALPEADIPLAMMSLRQYLDPAHHLAAGAALAPLRAEGVLIIGSGLSYHNLAAFSADVENPEADKFDAWLTTTIEGPTDDRAKALAAWAAAPGARASHPREDHLAPIFVAAGAAQTDPGQRVYHEILMGNAVSAYRFG
ncbi:MAG: dioxygenase [Alphaproteobacteria bacterium]|nr:dioxygenase [Alphaproteobacteria bacterium]